MFNPLKIFFPKKMLGIDIGASAIKIVEVSRWGGGKTLENYGQIKSNLLYRDSYGSSQEKSSYLLSNDFTAKVIRGILDEAKIKTKEAIFSLPDFSTFCTSFDLPAMTEKEIPGAIRYNASQYITLPVSEVTLDWQILPKTPGDKNSSLRVLLVAVPNQVVQDYQSIARMAGLNLYALESEAMGIARALAKNNKKVVCLVDMGVRSSTINIVDKGFLKKSYSFNFNSNQFTQTISSVLGIGPEQAEDLKNKEGLMYTRQDVVKTLYLLIDPLLIEVKNISADFFQKEKKQIEEIYLTGGPSNIPGLKEYFAETLKKNVLVPNCFSGFLYPPILEQTLRQMSPSFSTAVGVALGGLGI